MENSIIHHGARHIDFTLTRYREFGTDLATSPANQPELTAQCPDCGYTMMYRGLGRLRNGKLVHVYECVHSHREVYSLSIAVSE